MKTTTRTNNELGAPKRKLDQRRRRRRRLDEECARFGGYKRRETVGKEITARLHSFFSVSSSTCPPAGYLTDHTRNVPTDCNSLLLLLYKRRRTRDGRIEGWAVASRRRSGGGDVTWSALGTQLTYRLFKHPLFRLPAATSSSFISSLSLFPLSYSFYQQKHSHL